MLWSNWVQTYKGLSTKEPKEKNTRFAFLWSTHPRGRRESKEWNQGRNKHQTIKGLNPHLTGLTRIENQRERRMESVLFRPTCHGMNEGWREELQSYDPNQLIGHHGRATNGTMLFSRFAAVRLSPLRSEGMLWSRWCNHMSLSYMSWHPSSSIIISRLVH